VLTLSRSWDGASVPKTLPTLVLKSASLREHTDLLSDHLHVMNETLRRLDKVALFGEPFAACVMRLGKAGLLPGCPGKWQL